MRVLLVTGFYPGERMGGAEYQCSLIAQGLSKLGHTAGFLGTSAGHERFMVITDVQVWEINGWRLVGSEYHRKQIQRVVDEFQPDIVYVRLLTELADITAVCAPLGIAVVSSSCNLKETSPILWGDHVKEFFRYLRSGESLRHYRSFRQISRTQAHISNAELFTQRIRAKFPRQRAVTIYNGSPCPPEVEVHQEITGQVIWVNNMKRFKRAELYIQLAASLPQYRFLMIGANWGGRYGQRLLQMMQSVPNLEYLGALPLASVNAKISESDLLVYTSMKGKEGSANSFLQAWFRAVPTVSTFEMDYVPERERIGRISNSFDDLVKDVDELMSNHEVRIEMGQRAYAYARRAHSLEQMVGSYEKVFKEIVV